MLIGTNGVGVTEGSGAWRCISLTGRAQTWPMLSVSWRRWKSVAAEGPGGVDFVVVHEGFLEVVDVDEVFQVVVVRSPHLARLNQFKDNLAEVFGGGNAPVRKDSNGHQTEVFLSKFLNAVQKFVRRDVSGVFVAAIPAQIFLRMTESGKHELISIRVISASL